MCSGGQDALRQTAHGPEAFCAVILNLLTKKGKAECLLSLLIDFFCVQREAGTEPEEVMGLGVGGGGRLIKNRPTDSSG